MFNVQYAIWFGTLNLKVGTNSTFKVNDLRDFQNTGQGNNSISV